jgi:SRSO17 transposase
VAGARWTIEECFQTGKNEAAFHHYQARLYPAWYRYITLAFLAVTRAELSPESTGFECGRVWATGR